MPSAFAQHSGNEDQGDQHAVAPTGRSLDADQPMGFRRTPWDGGRILTGSSNTQGAPVPPLAGIAGPLTAFNGFAILAGNLAGGLCAVYADLFPRSGVGEKVLLLAVAFAVGGLVITPWVLSFNDATIRGAAFGGRIKKGYQLVLQRPSFAAMIVFMLIISAWCASSRLTHDSDRPGNLRALVAYADRTEAAARGAEAAAKGAQAAAQRTEAAVAKVEDKTNVLLTKAARIEQEVTKPLTPREILAKNGVPFEARSYHQALVNGDAQIVRDMLAAGWQPDSNEPSGDGNSLGHLFGRSPANKRTVEVIKVLKHHIDLTSDVVRLGASPVGNAASVAARQCNRYMVEALAAAGVNVKLQNKPRRWPGGDVEQDIVTALKTWKQHDWDFTRCEQADRDAILALIAPVESR